MYYLFPFILEVMMIHNAPFCSALGYSFLVVPLLVFLVLLTNKLDKTVKISYFAAASPLFLTFFTLIITSFGTRGGRRSEVSYIEF